MQSYGVAPYTKRGRRTIESKDECNFAEEIDEDGGNNDTEDCEDSSEDEFQECLDYE